MEEDFFNLVQRCKVALGEQRLSAAVVNALDLHNFIAAHADREIDVAGAEFEEVAWDSQSKVAVALHRAFSAHMDVADGAAAGGAGNAGGPYGSGSCSSRSARAVAAPWHGGGVGMGVAAGDGCAVGSAFTIAEGYAPFAAGVGALAGGSEDAETDTSRDTEAEIEVEIELCAAARAQAYADLMLSHYEAVFATGAASGGYRSRAHAAAAAQAERCLAKAGDSYAAWLAKWCRRQSRERGGVADIALRVATMCKDLGCSGGDGVGRKDVDVGASTPTAPTVLPGASRDSDRGNGTVTASEAKAEVEVEAEADAKVGVETEAQAAVEPDPHSEPEAEADGGGEGADVGRRAEKGGNRHEDGDGDGEGEGEGEGEGDVEGGACKEPDADPALSSITLQLAARRKQREAARAHQQQRQNQNQHQHQHQQVPASTATTGAAPTTPAAPVTSQRAASSAAGPAGGRETLRAASSSWEATERYLAEQQRLREERWAQRERAKQKAAEAAREREEGMITELVQKARERQDEEARRKQELEAAREREEQARLAERRAKAAMAERLLAQAEMSVLEEATKLKRAKEQRAEQEEENRRVAEALIYGQLGLPVPGQPAKTTGAGVLGIDRSDGVDNEEQGAAADAAADFVEVPTVAPQGGENRRATEASLPGAALTNANAADAFFMPSAPAPPSSQSPKRSLSREGLNALDPFSPKKH